MNPYLRIFYDKENDVRFDHLKITDEIEIIAGTQTRRDKDVDTIIIPAESLRFLIAEIASSGEEL